MANVFNPNIGFTPTGVNNNYQAQVIIGQDLSVPWTAVGQGPNGTISPVENVKINLSLISGTNGNSDGSSINSNPTEVANISFAAGDLAVILSNAQTLTYPIQLTLQEIIICNAGNSGRMIILGSQPYT